MRTDPTMLMASDYGLVRTEKNRHLGATNMRRSSRPGDEWWGCEDPRLQFSCRQGREVWCFVTRRGRKSSSLIRRQDLTVWDNILCNIKCPHNTIYCLHRINILTYHPDEGGVSVTGGRHLVTGWYELSIFLARLYCRQSMSRPG